MIMLIGKKVANALDPVGLERGTHRL